MTRKTLRFMVFEYRDDSSGVFEQARRHAELSLKNAKASNPGPIRFKGTLEHVGDQESNTYVEAGDSIIILEWELEADVP